MDMGTGGLVGSSAGDVWGGAYDDAESLTTGRRAETSAGESVWRCCEEGLSLLSSGAEGELMLQVGKGEVRVVEGWGGEEEGAAVVFGFVGSSTSQSKLSRASSVCEKIERERKRGREGEGRVVSSTRRAYASTSKGGPTYQRQPDVRPFINVARADDPIVVIAAARRAPELPQRASGPLPSSRCCPLRRDSRDRSLLERRLVTTGLERQRVHRRGRRRRRGCRLSASADGHDGRSLTRGGRWPLGRRGRMRRDWQGGRPGAQ